MKSKIIKKIFLLFVIFILCWLCKVEAAGSYSVSASKTSIDPNETVKLTITGNNAYGVVNISATNATLSETKVFLQNDTKTVEVTPTSSKNIKITLTPGSEGLGDNEEKPITTSKTINISVKNKEDNNNNNNNNNDNNSSNNNNGGSTGGATTNKPETPTKSSNANLSNLGITPNDFSGFTPGNTSYSVTVPNSVTSINVYANKGQKDQTISGTGTKTLQEGENQFSVVVTAQDGTKKTYTINVTREAMTQENTVVDETAIEDVTDVVGLKELTISGVELSPAFDQNVYEYTAKLIGDKTTLDIQAIPVNENQKVEIIGNEDLKEGENVITILVTGTTTTENTENTVTTNTTAEGTQTSENTITYQIIVNKSLVDEEAIAREKQEEQQKMQRMIIIGVLVLAIVIILIILLVRAIRSRREPEEFDGMYMQDNDNFINNQFETDNNINENKYSEKIEDNNYTDEYEEFDHKKRYKGKRFK